MTPSPQEALSETGAIRAMGPVSGVTVHAHMRSGPHSLMDYPLDLAVAVELMFLLGVQARRGADEEPLVVTPKSVMEHLRALGVRSSNGSGPVGRDAVYESFARLRAKGYIRRIELRKDNKAAGVAYEFYDFPAWNPEPPVMEATQVGAASGTTGSGDAGSRSKKRSKVSSSQVRPASGTAGTGTAGSRSAERASSQVRAASGSAGHPPHPPEEEGYSSSPSPLTRVLEPLPPQHEKPHFSAEEIAAAERFLQCMKRHQAGAATARKLAPLLLRLMAGQGWPKITGLDDEQRELLEVDIFKNTGGAQSWASCLPGWIKDLRRFEFVSAPPKRLVGGPVAWCGTCESAEYRWITPREGLPSKCPRCHPSVASATV